jgi:hypothetical protein
METGWQYMEWMHVYLAQDTDRWRTTAKTVTEICIQLREISGIPEQL